jgi:hypothetical protein
MKAPQAVTLVRIASFVGIFSAVPYALPGDTHIASGDLVCDEARCCPQTIADCCIPGVEECEPKKYDNGPGECPE